MMRFSHRMRFTKATYAGLDPMQMRGITGMGAFGTGSRPRLVFHGHRAGFAQNAQDIFNRTQDMLDDAVNYATSSPQAQPMVEAAMRDIVAGSMNRQLPGIDRSVHRQRATQTAACPL